jgi:PAS domain S-box-containing protein
MKKILVICLLLSLFSAFGIYRAAAADSPITVKVGIYEDQVNAYSQSSSNWLPTQPVITDTFSNWAKWTLISVALVTLFLIGGVAVFRREVKRKTRQLAAGIEDHKKAEIVLKASEEKYRKTLDTMMEGGQIIDFNYRYIYLNNTAVLHSRRTREDLLGHTMMEIYPGIENTELFRQIESCMKDRVPHSMVNLFTYPDGSKSWFDISINPVAEGVFLLSVDKTVRKNAEEALRESEHKLRQAQEIAHLGYWQWDVKTGDVKWSDEVYRIFGLDPENFTPRIDSIMAMSPWPEDHERDKELIFRAGQSHEPGYYEQKFQRPDQSLGYYFSNFQGIYDDSGGLVSIVGTVLDITESKISEQTIMEAKGKLEAVFQSMTDAVLITDTSGHFLDFNDAFATYYRCLNKKDCFEKKDRFRDYIEFYNPDGTVVPPDMWPVPRALRGETVNGIEYKTLRKDTGEAWWGSVSFNPVKDEENRIIGAVVVSHEITQRKKADVTLRESEENFRRTLEDSPFGILIVSSDDDIIYANRALLEIYGYDSLEEFRSVSVQTRYTPESYAEYLIRKDKRERGEEILAPVGVNIICKDGGIRSLETMRKEILWSGKRQHQIIYQDITQRKKAAEDLKASEDKFSRAFNSSPIGMAIMDLETQSFVEVNERWAEILEYQPADMLGRTTAELNMYSDMGVRTRLWQTLYKTKHIQNQEVVYRTKTGKNIQAVLSAEIVPLKGREFLISTLMDITESRKTEKALVESEEKLWRIYETVPEGIILIDTEGIILDANQAAIRMHGYIGRSKFIGINGFDLIAPDDRENAGRYLKNVMEKGVMQNVRLTLLRIDGSEFPGELSAAVIRDLQNNPVGIVIVTSDITARIAAQEEHQKIVEYRELDRVKTNLLSTISHELRTPLASIKGYSSMLLMYDRKLNKAQKNESIEAIDRSTDRLTELIDHLLDMSRLDAGILKLTLQPVDPLEILSAAVTEAKLRSPDFKFKNETKGKLPEIMADGRRLRQVIDNLLENAIKYSPENTRITVKTEVKQDEMLVSITDQGRGIPEGEYQKIFERMYRIEQRLQKDPGGLGLGLSLCKALVESHGGRIWVESVVNKGSTFYFTIPIGKVEKGKENDGKKQAKVKESTRNRR